MAAGRIGALRYKTLRWAGALFPAVIVGFFESVRHYYLEPLIPGMVGNVVTAALVISATSFFYSRFFRVVERINRRLSQEQSKTALLLERNATAREMHDGLSQSLFFLNVKLRAAARHLDQEAVPAAQDDL